MEGKEVRFGIANSALFATVTTDASCGAVNAMHDSFTPLGGLVPLANILLGEVIFGGVGAGLYGILIFIILTVFIAGLMVGRTPEYLGKKIEAFDVKMAMLAVLIFPLTILTLTGIAVLAPSFGTSSLLNQGPHGLTEILYAYTSGTGNNGSAFAGLSANTPWYNTTLGLAMLLGRFMVIIPMLALAGNLARKKIVPASLGTFPGDDAAVLHAPGRRHRDRRRPDVLPGGESRSHRRRPADAPRKGVLSHVRPHDRLRSRSGTARWCARALVDAVRKLNPMTMARNPVMFVVEVGAVLVTGRFAIDVATNRGNLLFEGQIVAWLWLTVLFANFAEAMAEGRGKAQADSLRRAKTDTLANRIVYGNAVERVPATQLLRGDVVLRVGW